MPTSIPSRTTLSRGRAGSVLRPSVPARCWLAATTSPNWYDFTLPAAADVSLSTVTPDNGAGQFSNTFDPYLELHDDSGDLLASAENNFGGTNALIDQPLAAGTYFVQVSAPPLTPAGVRSICFVDRLGPARANGGGHSTDNE